MRKFTVATTAYRDDTLRIVVNCEPITSNVSASKEDFRDISIPKEIKEEDDILYYNLFLDEIREIIKSQFNFEITKDAQSSRFFEGKQSLSHYFDFIVTNGDTKHIVVFTRISDHRISDWISRSQDYFDRTSNEYTSSHQRKKWKAQQFHINNIDYPTYEDALDAIERWISKVGKKYG